MKTSNEEKFCIVAIIIIVIAVFALVANYSISKTEVVECNKWNADAVGRPFYYAEEWQIEQCKAHNIELTAPVRQ